MKTSIRQLQLARVVLCLMLISAMARTCMGTEKSGTIVGETWTKAASPYYITGDILVVDLSIQPGTSIYFDSNYVFEVAGVLTAVGSESEHILFTQTNGAGGWQGVFFNYGAAGSSLIHCTVSKASNSGVRALYTSPRIEKCVFAENAGASGGGVYLFHSESDVVDCVFTNNSAGGGGGLCLSESKSKINGCLFLNNSSNGGGAVAAFNTFVVLTNCSFYTNTSGGLGGGILIDGQPVTNASSMDQCSVIGNSSGGHGGGVWVRTTKDFLVTKCEISKNRSSGDGGGLAAYITPGKLSMKSTSVISNTAEQASYTTVQIAGGGILVQGNATLGDNCQVLFNRCVALNLGNASYDRMASGGGVCVAGGTITLSSSLVSSNECVAVGGGRTFARGGGINQYGGLLETINCVIARNAVTAYGAYYGNLAEGAGFRTDAAVKIVNCTIAYNASEGVAQVGGDVAITNSILFFNNNNGVQTTGGTTVRYSDVQNGAPGEGNISQNPLFSSLTTFLLFPASPCIDGGRTNEVYKDTCFPPSQGTERNDMGAYGGPSACSWITGDAPVILGNPKSLNSCLGMNVSFRVSAVGAPPLSFQWYFNVTNLLVGETSTNLSLTDLKIGQSGIYSCVISNSFGTAASAPATLIVNDACVDIQMYAGLNISGQNGGTYVLKFTTDLGNTDFASWTPLATNTLTGSNWLYIDTASPLSPRRFYGVKLAP